MKLLDSHAGDDHALSLIANADALVEGYRSGVMEKLGLGPEAASIKDTQPT